MKHLYLKCLLLGILSLLCVKAKAYDCEIGGIYYNLYPQDTYGYYFNTNVAHVTYLYHRYSGSSNKTAYSGSVTIPSSITYNGKTYSVTAITLDAFRSCRGLTSVEIPSSVTSIGESAFYGCSGLTSIEIPSSVTSIGSSAFSDCSSLTSIEIPSGVTSIGTWAFSGCWSLTSVEIPSSVTSIERAAF